MMLYHRSTSIALALLALPSPVVVAQNCLVEQASISSCIATNVLNCLACDDALIAWASLTGECDGIDDICALADCCTPCASLAIDYGDCILQDGCDKTCDGVVPSAPSPAAPVVPFNITLSQEFSPECVADGNAFMACYFENLLACSTSCNEIETAEPVDFECSTIAAYCDNIKCCPPCIEIQKNFIACESNARGCAENCNDVQPVAPSPVAPFNFFPPTAPSPVAPVAPSVPGPCDELMESHTACLMQNILTCAFSDRCLSLPDISTAFDICDDGMELICAQFTCCAECVDTGNAAATCTLEIQGCTETVCGEFAPIAPSPVAPFTFSPFAPIAPSPFSPFTFPPLAPIAPSPFAPYTFPPLAPSAPFTFSPLAPSAPFTFPPFAPSAPALSPTLIGCEVELGLMAECSEANACDDNCSDLDFPDSCDAFPGICELAVDCCPNCEEQSAAILNCAARGQLGCSADCDGPIAPVTAPPVTVAPVTIASDAPVTVAPITVAPFTIASDAPVTVAPITVAPVTITSDAPVTVAPVMITTDAPVTGAPITKAPTSSAPVTMEPVTSSPAVPDTTSVPDTPSPATLAPTDSSASHNMGVVAIAGTIVAILCM